MGVSIMVKLGGNFSLSGWIHQLEDNTREDGGQIMMVLLHENTVFLSY